MFVQDVCVLMLLLVQINIKTINNLNLLKNKVQKELCFLFTPNPI